MRYTDGRKWAEAQWKAGKASRYIHKFDELKPGDRVWLVLCVSRGEQEKNLDDQQAYLTKAVEDAGGVVVGATWYIGSRFDSAIPIVMARKLAKRRKAKYLLAESTDRFVRHADFRTNDKKRKQYRATESQLQYLHREAGALRLMTYVDPDATAEQVHSHRTKRGQWAKGNRGGGSKRKGYGPRFEQLPIAERRLLREKYLEGKLKIRQLSDYMNAATRSTKYNKSKVQRWVSQLGGIWRRAAARSR